MGYRKLIVLFMLLLAIRMVPAYIGYAASGGNHIQMGDTDPLMYLWGAQTIIEKGNNPFNFFPPLNFIFIASSLWVFSGNILAPIITNACVGWLSIVGVYLFARKLYDKRTAILSAVVYGAYPNFIFYGASLYPETLAICLIIFSFLLLMIHFDRFHPAPLIGSAFLWGAASQTRGGVHLFSVALCLVIIFKTYKSGWKTYLKSAAIFLICTYCTVYAIGFLCMPFQGEQLLNSKSGMGSVLHGANKMINCCTDYGNVRGNLLYVINECGEQWPEGVRVYSPELLETGTKNILFTLARFVADDPMYYIKSCIERLSYLWSPNQKFIAFAKNKLYRFNPFFADTLCISAAVFYIIIILCAVWGIASSRDTFRLVFVLFILFYCALIAVSTGNTKLRLPMMPFMIIYASYFGVHLFRRKVMISGKLHSFGLIMLSSLFLFNACYKFKEILISPAEVYVRKIELCVDLGFPQTALYLYDNKHGAWKIDQEQKRRVIDAIEEARKALKKDMIQ